MAATWGRVLAGLVSPALGAWTWVHEVSGERTERPLVLAGALVLLGYSGARIGDWLLARRSVDSASGSPPTPAPPPGLPPLSGPLS